MSESAISYSSHFLVSVGFFNSIFLMEYELLLLNGFVSFNNSIVFTINSLTNLIENFSLTVSLGTINVL